MGKRAKIGRPPPSVGKFPLFFFEVSKTFKSSHVGYKGLLWHILMKWHDRHDQMLEMLSHLKMRKSVWPGGGEEAEQTRRPLLLELVMQQTHELLLPVHIERGHQRGEEVSHHLVTQVQSHLPQVSQHSLLILSLTLLKTRKLKTWSSDFVTPIQSMPSRSFLYTLLIKDC